MAHEYINQYIDAQVDQYNQLEKLKKEHPSASWSAMQRQVGECLMDFYLHVLKGRGKYSAQRRYCKEVLEKYWPAYARGLFKNKK